MQEQMFFRGTLPRCRYQTIVRKKERNEKMLGMTELAGEYHRSVELLEERLAQLKEEIKTARGPHYFDLKRRIELLRFELVDTRETERILHDYYN